MRGPVDFLATLKPSSLADAVIGRIAT